MFHHQKSGFSRKLHETADFLSQMVSFLIKPYTRFRLNYDFGNLTDCFCSNWLMDSLTVH